MDKEGVAVPDCLFRRSRRPVSSWINRTSAKSDSGPGVERRGRQPQNGAPRIGSKAGDLNVDRALAFLVNQDQMEISIAGKYPVGRDVRIGAHANGHKPSRSCGVEQQHSIVKRLRGVMAF